MPLDLDDGCPVVENSAIQPRIAIWKNGREIDVSVVFMLREYESIFLSCADQFIPDRQVSQMLIDKAESVRDAKGELRALLGRRYKESQDQAEMTKTVDMATLLLRSRSSQKLAKELFG